MREDDFRETARFTSAGEPAREEAAVLQRGFRETVGLDALGSSLAPPESARMEELLKMGKICPETPLKAWLCQRPLKNYIPAERHCKISCIGWKTPELIL